MVRRLRILLGGPKSRHTVHHLHGIFNMNDGAVLADNPGPSASSSGDLARVLLPEIQAFFESEDGQREYAEWKAKQQAEQENKV